MLDYILLYYLIKREKYSGMPCLETIYMQHVCRHIYTGII